MTAGAVQPVAPISQRMVVGSEGGGAQKSKATETTRQYAVKVIQRCAPLFSEMLTLCVPPHSVDVS